MAWLKTLEDCSLSDWQLTTLQSPSQTSAVLKGMLHASGCQLQVRLL